MTKKMLQEMVREAQFYGYCACGKLMDEFGIKRCPENYLKIIEILHEYRGVVRRAFTRRARARKGRKHA